MPGLDGIEVMRQMRATHPGVRVILSSGFAPDRDTPRAGEDFFLAKPYAASDLLQAVRGILQAARA